MQKEMTGFAGVIDEWQDIFSTNKTFRRKMIITLIILVLVIISLPTFFNYIEQRKGAYLHDLILQHIPAADVSLLTFLIIWSMSGLVIIRCIQRPSFALLMLMSFTLLCLARMVSITMVPLDPPDGLIRLNDPLTSLVYGGKDKFITKDLFFSGHTSNMFIMYLCLEKRSDKILALLASLLVAILVLIQHVHYTVDVLFAFIFTYLIFRIGKLTATH
jgi:membrane-associated phospholipid phosphatase